LGEIAATNPSQEKDFSASSARSLRRAIEILGWVAVSILVITGNAQVADTAYAMFTNPTQEPMTP
tara:strand:- start:302 stop:496 length:195 start_codon:yes stop_codon:yes gene_type:complete